MTGEAEALRDAPRSVREFFESVAESPDWLNLRYSICASGGTATGTPFSFRPPKGKDYLNFCGLDYHLKSFGRFDKRIELKWFMLGDTDQEGDEYFWLNLTNPRVKRWGSNMWESHSGSHHTPATIKIQIVIKDDDLTGRPVRMAQPYRGVGGAAPASSRRGVLSGHSA